MDRDRSEVVGGLVDVGRHYDLFVLELIVRVVFLALLTSRE